MNGNNKKFYSIGYYWRLMENNVDVYLLHFAVNDKRNIMLNVRYRSKEKKLYAIRHYRDSEL